MLFVFKSIQQRSSTTMVIFDVFAKNIKATYKSTLFSKATALVCILKIITIILPFIFAYESRGFWIKRDVFYEQPDIRFKGEYLFIGTTNNTNNPIITCGTIPLLEEKLEFLDFCSVIKVRETDKDFDDKMDQLNFNMTIELPKHSHLTSMQLILPLDYRLDDVCRFKMESAIVYQEFLPVILSNFEIVGDVIISQSSPLHCYHQRINNLFDYSVFKNTEKLDDLNNIITEYSNRNVSTKFANVFTSFITGNSGIFNIKVQANYPEQNIYYKPSFWQIIKWAWIQYFAIYIVISWFTTKIKTYIFNKKLVLYYEVNPLNKRK